MTMPPKGSRMHLVDHKPDGASKEKGSSGPSSAKMRRGASQTSASHLREAATAAPTSAPSQPIAEVLAPTVRKLCAVAFANVLLTSGCRNRLTGRRSTVKTSTHTDENIR